MGPSQLSIDAKVRWSLVPSALQTPASPRYIRPLKIVRADKDFAYTDSGLDDGDMIIVSSLDTVTEQMKVRIQADSKNAATFAEVVENQNRAPEVRTE